MTIRALLIGALVAAAAALPTAAAAAPSFTSVGTFSSPMFVAAPPGDTRSLVVVERAGRLRYVEEGVPGSTLFADISDRVITGGERGMLSAAFRPDYAQSGLLYVFYVALNSDIVVAELRRDPSDPRRADPGYYRDVLRVPHRVATNHYGGQVAFGGDGYLYVATGDGGGNDDPLGSAQNMQTLLGKLLRINPVPGDGCGGGCRIPPDNPYVAGGGRPEIWGHGLRNPWRFSFDRLTGDLVLADVGQDQWEEINHVPAATGGGRGANFGWNCMEGVNQNHPSSCSEPASHTPPVITKPNNPWFSITGGVVVRDPHVPTLAGRLLFTDFFRTDPMLGAQLRADQGTETTLHGLGQTTSVSDDGCARVHVTDMGGEVRRVIEDAGGACAGPAPLPPPFAGASLADYTIAPGQEDGPRLSAGSTNAVDRTRPRVRLAYARRQRTLRTRRIRLAVRCDEGCRVRITGRFGPRRRALPRRTRLLAANAPGRITLTLSRRAARRLRRDQRRTGKRVLARLTVRATDNAGNTRTRTLTIRLRR